MKSAFTLIELLVAIAIISILATILLPSLTLARELSLEASCKSNLKTIGVNLHLYAADNDNGLPSGAHASTSVGTWFWWEIIGDVGEELFSSPSDYVRKSDQPLYQCKAKENHATWAQFGYGWNFEYFGYYAPPETQGWNTRISEVEDGTTLVVGDNSDIHPVFMTWAMNVYIKPDLIGDTAISRQVSRHRGGGNYLGVDGHVEWLHWQDDVLDDRNAVNYGVTYNWGGAYGNKINAKFTTALD